MAITMAAARMSVLKAVEDDLMVREYEAAQPDPYAFDEEEEAERREQAQKAITEIAALRDRFAGRDDMPWQQWWSDCTDSPRSVYNAWRMLARQEAN